MSHKKSQETSALLQIWQGFVIGLLFWGVAGLVLVLNN